MKNVLSHEMNNKKRKLSKKNLISGNVVGKTNSCISKINNMKKEIAFQILVCAVKNSKLNPTNRKLPIRSNAIRGKQTMFNKTPAPEGIANLKQKILPKNLFLNSQL